MLISKYKIYATAFFAAVFFSFSGYYVLLMLCSNLLGLSYSQYFTIPVRILIIALLFICFMLIGRKEHIKQPVFVAFILFSLVYVYRIAEETLAGVQNHMSNGSFLLYYLSFCFLPFLFLFLKKDLSSDLKFYKWAILLSGLILAVLSIVFYRDIIGTVGRISLAVSKDENYISPLALSYSGSLAMGVALLLLLTNTNSKFVKVVLWGIAGISCVPFFLGASRGSVLALAVPFVLLILNHRSKLTRIYLLIASVLFSIGVVVLSEQFGSAVIDRFSGIESGISSGSSSAVRIDIWRFALNHFADSPFLGSSLEVAETGHHPHNIFIEVLMATGVVGFIPFIFLLGKTTQYSLYIFKHKPELSWVAAIFLQNVIHSSFSGAIYGSSWLFFSMAVILSLDMKPERFSSQSIVLPERKQLSV